MLAGEDFFNRGPCILRYSEARRNNNSSSRSDRAFSWAGIFAFMATPFPGLRPSPSSDCCTQRPVVWALA